MIDIESSKVTRVDVDMLRQLFEREGYSYFAESERCLQYSKIIVNEKQTGHPDVTVLVCYDKAEEPEEVKRFRVLIMNEWDGQELEIKQEINRMGDVLYEELVKLVGKGNITIERKATGPPF